MDQSASRWRKYRPGIIWGAIMGYAVGALFGAYYLVYVSPYTGVSYDTGQLLWAGVLAARVSVPVGILLGMLMVYSRAAEKAKKAQKLAKLAAGKKP